MSISDFWGLFSYLAALIIGVFLVAKKIIWRPHFALRAAACVAVIFLYKIGYDEMLRHLMIAESSKLLLRTIDSFNLYTLTMLSVGFCFECDIWAMLFCATSGYCMQHMSQRTYLILRWLLLPDASWLAGAALICAVTAVYYVGFYYAIIKKADYRGTMLDSRIQILISFMGVAIMIFLSIYALRAAESHPILRIYILLFSALCAILAFFVEFGWLAAKKAEIESGMLRQLSEDARKNYLIESDIIEIMNIRCHDLNHALATLAVAEGTDELANLQHTANVYDSIFKTGNHALDVTLTRISLLCEKKKITLTCSVDGTKLQYMSETDIYSLFSNLLFNAIEAVDSIDVPGRRLISLTTRDTPSAFTIHEENYRETTPQFEDGLPQTTKKDRLYHGFGTKSIRMVCEKYGGTCSMSASDGIFEVDIRLPREG